LFFSESVTLRVRKEFAGASQQDARLSEPVRLASAGETPAPALSVAGKPPRIQDLLAEEDWLEYSAAFA
jgi:hypothetical protein